jgi:hypothetical protein
MFPDFRLLARFIAVSALLTLTIPATGSAAVSPAAEPCAGTKSISETTLSTGLSGPPAVGAPCWGEVQPYPFGVEGEAVNTAKCAPGAPVVEHQVIESCYLKVTSMVFRAWNRGLAATTAIGGGNNPLGVWLYNGSVWYPSPGFLGPKTCSGHTVVWAGKRDYWLIGSESSRNQSWADVCRFDGAHLEWEPLPIPQATLEHAAAVRKTTPSPEDPNPKPEGEITSAACFAWNNCWFFGTSGTVVHWDGHTLADASPGPSQHSLAGDYVGAAAREGPSGELLGLAAATPNNATGEGASTPALLYGSSGGAFSPLAFSPFPIPLAGEPDTTNLVAVDLDAAGRGWVAGRPSELATEPQPAPLEPVAATGEATTCAGPPAQRFTDALSGSTGFTWSSGAVSVIPTDGEVIAGGQLGTGTSPAVAEPVIVRANCHEDTTVTRFRVADAKSPRGEVPADETGRVEAIAANAKNDAWAATNSGQLAGGPSNNEFEPPRLYRLTNGEPPEAPEGNDEEDRPSEAQTDAVIEVLEPPPPPPPPETPLPVTETHTVKLPAAVYDVKAKLHTTKSHGHVNLSLYLSFKLRRPVTVGAQALRHGHVVSIARARHFRGKTGLLILRLNRKHWPTNVKFVT